MPARRANAALVFLAASLGQSSALDFKKDIQPIMKKHCYECHSEQAKKRKAGLVFDDLHSLVYEIGPNGQVVPGNVAESHLFEVLTNEPGAKNHMPPDNKPPLSSSELKKIENWIKEGGFLVNPGTKAPPAGLAKRKWRNKERQEIEASFVKLEGPNVYLKMADGRVLPYPVEKLSADSQIQIRKALLEAAGEKPRAEG